jgi:S1-C subfamily serine protease
MNAIADLSSQLADAVERASEAVVQVHSGRRAVAGVVVAEGLVATPARALGDDTATVRLHDGRTIEGAVLGQALSLGLGVVRVPELGIRPLAAAPDPRVGHLALAIGRTWSGNIMATLTNIAVIGGPLRTSRTSQIDRVLRIAQSPHGALAGGALVDVDGLALGLITSSAIRGTTVVLPAPLVWPATQQLAAQGGTRQGFIGLSSVTVAVPERQRSGHVEEHGLLVTGVVANGPADRAGILLGDVILAFEGQAVQDPEALATRLRGDRVGKPVTLTLLRGVKAQDVAVTVGERPRR